MEVEEEQERNGNPPAYDAAYVLVSSRALFRSLFSFFLAQKGRPMLTNPEKKEASPRAILPDAS